MDADKLKKLIEDENQEREYQTLRSARTIINDIANKKQKIANLNTEIAELQKDLRELSVETLDEAEVLGA